MANLYGMPDELIVEADGPIRIVRLNRPDNFNTVNEPLHTALASVWPLLEADPEVRAIVLTGNGRAFSGGGDINWFDDISASPQLRRKILKEARQVVEGMANLTIPVVSAVNGPAVGLGCSIAVMADVVLMSSDSYFADPHVAVGLVAGDGGVVSWPLMTSILKAKEYILLGDRVPAQTAVELGLASYVVPSDELMTRAMDYANRFAALPSQAVRNTKRAFNLLMIDAATKVLDFALAAEGESFTDDEHLAAVKRFMQSKRS